MSLEKCANGHSGRLTHESTVTNVSGNPNYVKPLAVFFDLPFTYLLE